MDIGFVFGIYWYVPWTLLLWAVVGSIMKANQDMLVFSPKAHILWNEQFKILCDSLEIRFNVGEDHPFRNIEGQWVWNFYKWFFGNSLDPEYWKVFYPDRDPKHNKRYWWAGLVDWAGDGWHFSGALTGIVIGIGAWLDGANGYVAVAGVVLYTQIFNALFHHGFRKEQEKTV